MHMIYLPICLCYQFFHQCYTVFQIQIFYLLRFLPKYFILFDAIINGITFLISFSVSLLLVYRNEKDFCTLIVNSMTLTKSLMSSDNFEVISLGLSIDSITMKIKDACFLEGKL